MPKFPMCPKCHSINVAIDPANPAKFRCLWAACNEQFDDPSKPKEEKKS